MPAQRCMGWHLTYPGKITPQLAHRHEQRLLVHKERETIEEANEQMFKGALRMAQRLRNGVVILSDTMENSSSW